MLKLNFLIKGKEMINKLRKAIVGLNEAYESIESDILENTQEVTELPGVILMKQAAVDKTMQYEFLEIKEAILSDLLTCNTIGAIKETLDEAYDILQLPKDFPLISGQSIDYNWLMLRTLNECMTMLEFSDEDRFLEISEESGEIFTNTEYCSNVINADEFDEEPIDEDSPDDGKSGEGCGNMHNPVDNCCDNNSVCGNTDNNTVDSCTYGLVFGVEV